MKHEIIHYSNRNIFITCAAILLVLTTASCARKISFATSSVVPAAEGAVKIKYDRNDNHQININIKHLAPPQKLQPAKSAYVVWMVTKDHGTRNIGQLKVSGGLFSTELKATLKTTTPFDPTKIFITAESRADIAHPGMQVLLQTKTFKVK